MASGYLQSRKDYLFTSESVSAGHPDKLCDQVSDAIVDMVLSKDADARMAIETAVTTDRMVLMGEYRTHATISHEDLERVARETVQKIGYDGEGFDYRTFAFETYLHEQSADIARGVDANGRASEGAGDQGIMFGFACKETASLMPAAIHYSHAVMQSLQAHRLRVPSCGLGPDAKTQVTLRFVDGQPQSVHTLVLSTQHSADMDHAQVLEQVLAALANTFPKGWLNDETRLLVNPTGRFVTGGPMGDAGLTGRKIVVDTYGGAAPHGGGAFSGKDPTKVDRSATYAARYIAKNVVAAGLAERCLIKLSYAIGRPEPLAVYLDTQNTGVVDDQRLGTVVGEQLFALTPRGIREQLQLQKPIYNPTSVFGHFGRDTTADGHFSWERLDLVDTLQRLVS